MRAQYRNDGSVVVALEAGETLATAEGPDTVLIQPLAGLMIWDALSEAGVTIEPAASAVPASISNRQFAQALAEDGTITQAEALAWVKRGELPHTLTQALAQIEDAGQRFAAEMLLSAAKTYERHHPLVAQLGALLGWDAAALDALWIRAAAL